MAKILGVDVEKPIWMLTRTELAARRSASIADTAAIVRTSLRGVHDEDFALLAGRTEDAKTMQKRLEKTTALSGKSLNRAARLFSASTLTTGIGPIRWRRPQ